jgi:hypothetical protein
VNEPELSPGVRARLAHLRRTSNPDLYLVESPTWGEADSGALRLMIDPTRWVVDVEVARVTERMRTPKGLREVVLAAQTNADLRRMKKNAELRDLTPEQLARGRDLIAGRRKLKPPPFRRPPPMTRPDGVIDRLAVEPAEPRFRGTSQEGEVTVVMVRRGGIQRLTVDADWLAGASAELLRYALKEAFQAAYDEGAKA